MKSFKLVRKHDVSGVSGTGEVAEGVVFHDGQVVMSWFGQHHTLEIAPSIDSVIAIHGHNGATEVVYDEDYCKWCGHDLKYDENLQVIHEHCYSKMLEEVIGS